LRRLRRDSACRLGRLDHGGRMEVRGLTAVGKKLVGACSLKLSDRADDPRQHAREWRRLICPAKAVPPPADLGRGDLARPCAGADVWAVHGVRCLRARPCNCPPWALLFQSNAEFLQGRFRKLCSIAIALGKQEHCIRKLSPGRIFGQSANGYDARQSWPSDVKCLKQAVIRSGEQYGR
jgi:hypothetical protein